MEYLYHPSYPPSTLDTALMHTLWLNKLLFIAWKGRPKRCVGQREWKVELITTFQVQILQNDDHLDPEGLLNEAFELKKARVEEGIQFLNETGSPNLADKLEANPSFLQ